jgi:hypothetical protein
LLPKSLALSPSGLLVTFPPKTVTRPFIVLRYNNKERGGLIMVRKKYTEEQIIAVLRE